MAGASSRFTMAGYTKPKYMLTLSLEFDAFFHKINENSCIESGFEAELDNELGKNFKSKFKKDLEGVFKKAFEQMPKNKNSTKLEKDFSKVEAVNFTPCKRSLFYYAVAGFRTYFKECELIFICRNLQGTEAFIKTECETLGIKNFRIATLKDLTQGQAHSLYLGLQDLKIAQNESILVFNIDSFRPNFSLPTSFDLNAIDGYLEVFLGQGEQWSFVLPFNTSEYEGLNSTKEKPCKDFGLKALNFPRQEGLNSKNIDENSSEFKVAKTTEKERISPLCSTGLYYFSKAYDFMQAFENTFKNGTKIKNEYYIAPLYNELIQGSKDIRYHLIDTNEVIFCGTPSEYEALLKTV